MLEERGEVWVWAFQAAEPPEALQGELVTLVARLEAELFIEAVGVGTALVGRELHKIAPSRLALGDRPFKHLLA